MKDHYDLVIIGAGPAGMTAGVFAIRKGLNTLIVSKEIGGQINWTNDIENYMGFEEIDGPSLVKKFEAQLKEHRLPELAEDVRQLTQEGEWFKILTESNRVITAKSVIVCSGKKPKTLNVPGEVEFRNKGVSYCSTCDGPLFRGLPVAVVGGGNSALKSALDLAHYATEVYLVSLTALTADAILINRLSKEPKIRTYLHHTVVEIQGEKTVDRVVIEDVNTKVRNVISVQGVFIEIGLDPNTDFVGDEVDRNEERELLIDCGCRTNIPGLYAAGDVSSVPEKQIIIAAGEGAKAAIKAWEYLIHLPDSGIRH